jgi:hypothetical protein
VVAVSAATATWETAGVFRYGRNFSNRLWLLDAGFAIHAQPLDRLPDPRYRNFAILELLDRFQRAKRRHSHKAIPDL